MDRHALTAKNSIAHILRGIPADDAELSKFRDVLGSAIEALKTILEKCQDEAHRSLSASVPREVECPCSRCKAAAYIEVIQGLEHDELMELIMYGSVDAGETPTDCSKPLDNFVVEMVDSAKPAGGAGMAQ